MKGHVDLTFAIQGDDLHNIGESYFSPVTTCNYVADMPNGMGVTLMG